MIAKDAFDGFYKEQWKHIDGIVLSPGPGTPHEQPPLSHQAISENPDLPILGVCLGHQLMALNYGAKVDKAPRPIHGQDHCIILDNTTAPSLLFCDVPSSFRVVRYHSLAAYDLPDCLQVLARSEGDSVIQAMQHAQFPHYGVQFHPESIGTQHGMELIENFCKIVQSHKKSKQPLNTPQPIPPTTDTPSISRRKRLQNPRFQVVVHPFQAPVEPEHVFESLYQHEPYSIWLDSSSASVSRGEIDILAAPCSSSDIFEYHYLRQSNNSQDILALLEQEMLGIANSNNNNENEDENVTRRSASNEMAVLLDLSDPIRFENEDGIVSPFLPFHYRGGFLGYLGYEVRHDTQKYLQRIEGGVTSTYPSSFATIDNSTDYSLANTPTAAFFLARNSLVFHHPTKQWYMISLIERDQNPSHVLSWMKTAKDRILHLKHLTQNEIAIHPPDPKSPERSRLEFIPNRSKSNYLQDIAKCHEFILEGESYELCLTNQLEAHLPSAGSTWQLYKRLRCRNPAPYSAYFRWQQKEATDTKLTICCSSPERFMSVKRLKHHLESSFILQAEAKPIKGTEARILPANGHCRTEAEDREDRQQARNLEISLKNRAENLMIVDLLRNDMSRVCQVGSVHVAKLMAIESFATVHQMVSTIRGTLATSDEGGATCFDLLRASFPGGSMTGAPKIRTMELLELLEQNVDRGPYAGSLGYISVNGCMDMNIIIRSAVITQDKDHGQRIQIGTGGAITALSDNEDEYKEMLLKARAVVETVQEWAATIQDDGDFLSLHDSNSTYSSSIVDV